MCPFLLMRRTGMAFEACWGNQQMRSSWQMRRIDLVFVGIASLMSFLLNWRMSGVVEVAGWRRIPLRKSWKCQVLVQSYDRGMLEMRLT